MQLQRMQTLRIDLDSHDSIIRTRIELSSDLEKWENIQGLSLLVIDKVILMECWQPNATHIPKSVC